MMQQILKKLRRYEIRVRKAINAQMQGNFHSVFKGSGLEFDDVRAYQYGDDVRHIDWNVSAKGHGTFIKTFKEEKEQTVFFVLDVSASQEIGVKGQQKIDIGKEICGVLALSAIKEASSAGLLCFSDEKEKYIRPNKGPKHIHEIVNALFKTETKSIKTNLKKALGTTLGLLKRKSVIVLVSDFLDEGYERNLKAIANKHDLVVIHLADSHELDLLKVGIAPVFFKESGKSIYLNTSSGEAREKMKAYYKEKQETVKQLCRRNNASYAYIKTDEDFVSSLVKLFKVRNRIGR